MVTDFDRDQSLRNLAMKLEARAELVRLSVKMGNRMIVNWLVLRQDILDEFDYVIDMLGVDESEDEDENHYELDLIEGEEEMEIDIMPHPLDPDDGDDEEDEWFEGFDDA